MHTPDLLDHGLGRAPDRDCVVQGAVRFTFADVDDRAARVVTALAAAGVGPGDRVVLLAANEPEFLELQVGCQRAGAVFVPVNYRLARPELAAIIADCDPALLVHGPGFGESAAALGVPRVWHLGDGGLGHAYDEVLGAARPAPRGLLDAAATAQILYTSGTTGTPKGAVIGNGALFARVAAFTSLVSIGEDAVFLQTLPLFHLASLVSFAFTASGATCVTIKDFEPLSTLRVAAEEGCTHAIVVPTIIDALLGAWGDFDGDLGRLGTVYYGASPIAPSLLTRAIATFGCGFAQFYGMTEGGIATMLEVSDHDPVARPELMTAAGRDFPYYRTDVVRPDGDPAARGEVGEITIAGPGLFDGYWRNPTATAEAVRSGRLHTGDAGYRNDAGYVYVTDRIKDMIITGGENVFCREVEAALLAHPAVVDAAVIGLDDERWGQRVHAVLVCRVALDEEVLRQWCGERLAGYKCPRSYEVVQALPRNAVGKITKHVLRATRTGV